jgi:uncharacterized protein involved in tellurium resistance
METVKDTIIAHIKDLPDDASYKDVMCAIYVIQNVEKGLEELRQGQYLTNQEAMDRLKKWLK